MSSFLSNRKGTYWAGLAIAMVMQIFAPRPVVAEQSEPLGNRVASARAAAAGGNYVGAVSQGISTLEACPEADWQVDTLRRFTLEVSERWFPRLSRQQQESAMELLADPKSPGAKWVRVYGMWRLGQPIPAIAKLMPLIREHPDSVGAEYAIRGLLIVQATTLGDAGLKEAVKAVVDAAPNNPSSAWAVCNLTWRYCAKNRVHLVRKAHTEIIALGADTLAGSVARQLADMVDAIESGDYAAAAEVLSVLRDYCRTGTIAAHVIDTFFLRIDKRDPQASADRIAGMQRVFGAMADDDPDGEARSFAIAILARILEMQHKNTESADQLQRIVDSGVEILESYALSRIGRLCFRSDPNRAISALERFRQVESPAPIITKEHLMFMLGRLYVRQKQYAKGQELYSWLLEEDGGGGFLSNSTAQTERLKAGLAGCLFGLGKDADARALIDPVLAGYRYGTAPARLTPGERKNLRALLVAMGKPAEAVRFLEPRKR